MQLFENILALVAEAKVRSLIEEHTHALVGELVAKAVLVRVVDPFGHPQKGLGPGQTRRVPAGCKQRLKMTAGLTKPARAALPCSAAELSQL